MQSAINVSFDEFAAACSHRPKRARPNDPPPRKDIVLSADPEGVLVESFVLSAFVAADKAWTFRASVEAAQLARLCGVLKKMGAGGRDIQLGVDGADLVFVLGGTRLTLPTISLEPG